MQIREKEICRQEKWKKLQSWAAWGKDREEENKEIWDKGRAMKNKEEWDGDRDKKNKEG